MRLRSPFFAWLCWRRSCSSPETFSFLEMLSAMASQHITSLCSKRSSSCFKSCRSWCTVRRNSTRGVSRSPVKTAAMVSNTAPRFSQATRMDLLSSSESCDPPGSEVKLEDKGGKELVTSRCSATPQLFNASVAF